jgi:hypothetical protein
MKHNHVIDTWIAELGREARNGRREASQRIKALGNGVASGSAGDPRSRRRPRAVGTAVGRRPVGTAARRREALEPAA